MNRKINCISVGDIATNCWFYALQDGQMRRSCVVIDPGDEAGLIISRLGELNWVPSFIFLTHGHFDHLAGLPDLLEGWEKAFSSTAHEIPRIGIHRLDAHYLGKDALSVHRKSFSAAGGSSAYVDALWKSLPEADIFFEEGGTAGPFRVLHVPGHTPGSVCFYDEEAGVLFSGDTLFRGDWGRTDLPGGNDNLIRQSLKRLLSLKGDTVVCPGHGPATTIEEEAGLLGQ
jgi:glyoxylase-like metal-dependent hydrolase (beta-lactamase superfamily II)